MVDACVQNRLKFSWILADIGFTSTENMEHLKQTRQKDFIMALKGNRLVALGEADRKNGHYTGLDPLQWPEQKAVTGWLKGLDFPSGLSGESLQTRKAERHFVSGL